MKRIQYKGRVVRPTMRTHVGVREKYDLIGLAEIQRHCNVFLRSRNLPVGMPKMVYGKEEA